MDISISLNTVIGFALYSTTLATILWPLKGNREYHFWISLFTFSAYNLASGLVSLSTTLFVLSVFITIKLIDFTQHTLVSKCSYTFISLLSLILALHLLPGFNNEKVYGPSILEGSTLPFSLYANLDKAYGALLLLYLHYFRLKTLKIYPPSRYEFLVGGFGIIAIFALALQMGTSWSFKFGELTWAFIFFNLFVTCVAEEAFFRLVIQDRLYKYISSKWQLYTVPLLTSSIFMLAHFHTGEGAAERLSLIFLAGLLYALVYQLRRSLMSAILIHFLLNFLHFSFFSYPASF